MKKYVLLISIVLVFAFNTALVSANIFDDIISLTYPHIKIKDLYKDSSKYQEKYVVIKGKVTGSINFGIRGYFIDDGTGKIYVSTENEIPKDGAVKSVVGKVKQIIKIFDSESLTIEEKKTN